MQLAYTNARARLAQLLDEVTLVRGWIFITGLHFSLFRLVKDEPKFQGDHQFCNDVMEIKMKRRINGKGNKCCAP